MSRTDEPNPHHGAPRRAAPTIDLKANADDPAPPDVGLDQPADEGASASGAQDATMRPGWFMALAAAGLAGGLGGSTLAIVNGMVPRDERVAAGSSPIAALTTRLGLLEQNASASAPRSAVEALEKRLATLPALPVDALTQRISALEADSKARVTPAPAAPDPALLERLSKAEAALALLAQTSGSTATLDQAGALSDRLKAIEARIESFSSEAGNRHSALEARIASAEALAAKLETGLAGVPATVEKGVGTVLPRISTLETQTRALADRVTGQSALLPVATIVRQRALAEAVLQGLRSGKPYARELAALSALGLDKGRIEPLAAFADGGAPSAAVLRAEFARISNLLAAGTAAPAGGGIGEKLVTSLSGLVVVRPSGEAAGDSPASIVARIEAAFERGDLAAALANWRAFNEDTRKANAAFGDRLAARVAAGEAAERLSSEALAAIANPGG